MHTPTKLATYSAKRNDEDRESAQGFPRGSSVRRLAADSIRLRRWAWHRWGAGRISFEAVRLLIAPDPTQVEA